MGWGENLGEHRKGRLVHLDKVVLEDVVGKKGMMVMGIVLGTTGRVCGGGGRVGALILLNHGAYACVCVSLYFCWMRRRIICREILTILRFTGTVFGRVHS